MSKKIKILLVLFIVAVLSVLYFFQAAKPVVKVRKQISGQFKEKTEKIDLKRVKTQYKEDVNNILSDYSSLIKKSDVSVGQIKAIQNKLLGLNVPSVFRDLHVNLVLAMAKMESFLSSGNSEDKFFSQKMIEKNKEKYSWLK